VSEIARGPIRAKNLWLDKRNGRYYCQIAVPKDLLRSDKKQIRKVALAREGECSVETLLEQLELCASHIRTEFAEQRKTLAAPAPAPAPVLPQNCEPAVEVLTLQLSNEILVRAVATAYSAAVNALLCELAACRQLASSAERMQRRQTLVAQMKEKFELACFAQADQATEEAFASLTALESEHHVRFSGSRADRLAYAKAYNAESVKFIQKAIEVIQGLESEESLSYSPEKQLPLLEIWGTSTVGAVERWCKKGADVGRPRKPKTEDKYLEIATTFDAILVRRPVESSAAADLTLFIAMLRDRGNSSSTIATKLGILRSLIAQFDGTEAVDLAIDDLLEALGDMSANRMQFTRSQLSTAIHGFYDDSTLPANDPHIAAMVGLLATRLEEVCQARGTDITLESTQAGEKYWLVHIRSSSASGCGDAVLKNEHSNRRLPLLVGTLPRLDAFLASRMGSPERLFQHLTPDQYGTLSSAVSKRLNRRIDKLISSDKRLVLQSLRTTGALTMRRANVDYAQRVRFLGHAPSSVHEEHYEAAQSLDAEDLLPAARALAAFYKSALEHPVANAVSHHAGQVDRQLQASDCGNQPLNRNHAVAAPDGASDMACQRVMHLFSDAVLPAQGLECVAEAVKDEPTVGDSTPLALSEEASEEFPKITTSAPVVVGLKVREQPLMATPALALDIAVKASRNHIAVQWNQSARTTGFDTLTFAIFNAQHPSKVVFQHIGNTQLAQFLQASTRGQSEHGDPGDGLAAASKGSGSLGVDPCAEDATEAVFGKTHPLDGFHLRPRNLKTSGNVRRQVPRVVGGLQHCTDERQLLRDRLPGIAALEQMVPIGGDIGSHQLRRRLLHEVLKRSSQSFELPHGAGGAVRIQSPPVPI
jgi:integrase